MPRTDFFSFQKVGIIFSFWQNRENQHFLTIWQSQWHKIAVEAPRQINNSPIKIAVPLQAIRVIPVISR